MSKSIVIIDTPECCGECPLRYRTEDVPLGNYTYQMTWRCKMEPDGIEDGYIDPLGKKPDWCPLEDKEE